MNASPHHSKVKVSMTLANPIFVAGGHISGKMEMECRADKGLGISVMMVELFASQGAASIQKPWNGTDPMLQSSPRGTTQQHLCSCTADDCSRALAYHHRMQYRRTRFQVIHRCHRTTTRRGAVYRPFSSASRSRRRHRHPLALARTLHGSSTRSGRV